MFDRHDTSIAIELAVIGATFFLAGVLATLIVVGV